MSREIKRAQHGTNAVRLESCHGVHSTHFKSSGVASRAKSLDRDIDFSSDGTRFGFGFPKWFASLSGDYFCQLVRGFSNVVTIRLNYFDPLV